MQNNAISVKITRRQNFNLLLEHLVIKNASMIEYKTDHQCQSNGPNLFS